RMKSSPPGTQVSTEARIEKSRNCGDNAIVSAASTMATAEPTDSCRNRSTSMRRWEAPITSTGRRTRPASQRRASLIFIALVGNEGQRGRQHGVAEPLVKTSHQSRHSRERLDHDSVENGVEESAFE